MPCKKVHDAYFEHFQLQKKKNNCAMFVLGITIFWQLSYLHTLSCPMAMLNVVVECGGILSSDEVYYFS